MIGFQPYETFQLLIETGGVDRANTLLVAACDAFARRRMPPAAEVEQFEALARRLFPMSSSAARAKAAATLGRAGNLSSTLEQLVIENIGDDMAVYLESSTELSEQALLAVVEKGDIAICSSVSRRMDIPASVLAKLFQMNSRKVYRALASNMSIEPQGPYLNALARSAQMDHQVAWTLASRNDFDVALLAPVFFDLGEVDRVKVIQAYAGRETPEAPIKKTLEQLSVANSELTRALMKLFTENRRPEVTNLLQQVTGLDEVRCGQISHDVSGAALFVVLRSFGCTAYDGLKVLIHATSHDEDRSKILSDFAKLFQEVSIDSMIFLMSSWRGDVNLLDLTKPEYLPGANERRSLHVSTSIDGEERVAEQAMDTLERLSIRRAS